MQTPPQGTQLTSSSVTFAWTQAQGEAACSGYALYVGTSPGGYQIYGALEAGLADSRQHLRPDQQP